MANAVMWFRRDLRLDDHPALNAAADAGPVTALFVLDDALRKPSGAPRLAYLYRSLRALEEQIAAAGGRLVVRRGKPENVLPAVAAEVGADSVHISADAGPYGRQRDERVERALGDVPLVRTGSPYVITPGRLTKQDGSPFRVYSPYYRAWVAHGWREPARPHDVQWMSDIEGTGIPADPRLPSDIELPTAGEAAARDAWRAYRERVADYADVRNRPDLDRTSRMSVYLKYGQIHPRTMLHELDSETFRKELAWRDFYATILWFYPDSAREYFLPGMARMAYATGPEADEHLRAWQQGRTGYPIVDAGIRQMLHSGWMHNRVRMIVASFLVKDLHIEWQFGARYFMKHLVDGDLASNNHGWQWVAGSGTDPAPYFRIFNPVSQGEKFDPDGDYVRRWVPELRGIDGGAVHEPWTLPDPPADYPAPIVDHKRERAEALDRYAAVRDNR